MTIRVVVRGGYLFRGVTSVGTAPPASLVLRDDPPGGHVDWLAIARRIKAMKEGRRGSRGSARV